MNKLRDVILLSLWGVAFIIGVLVILLGCADNKGLPDPAFESDREAAEPRA